MNESGSHASDTIHKMLLNSVMVFVLLILMLGVGALVDSYVIGTYLGEENMAAYGLAIPVQSLFVAFGSLFYVGAESLVAKQMGLGDAERANQYFLVALREEIVIAVLVCIGCLTFSSQIAGLLGATGDSAHLATYVRDYLMGYIPGLPAYALMLTLGTLIQLDGGQRRVVVAFVCMLVAEATCDFVSVLGFGADIFGIGLANTLGYYLAAGILLVHFVFQRHTLHITLGRANRADLIPLLRHGAPTAAGNVGSAVQTMLINYILLAVASNVEVAAFGIESSVWSLLTVAEFAVSSATLVLASLMLGEENTDGLRDTLRFSWRYVLMAQTLVAVLGYLFAPSIVEVFSSSAEQVVQPAVDCVRCLAISLPISGLNAVFISYLQGIHRVRGAAVAFACRSLLFIVSLSYALGIRFGASGVWAAIPISELAVLVAIVIVTTVRLGRLPRSIDDFLYLPDGFGVPDSDVLEGSITGIGQVSAFTEKVLSFCADRGASRRTADVLAHCVEETAVNIICSGFLDGKPHCIDLRVVAKNGSFILRVRDDCPQLDPEKQLRQHDPSKLAEDLSVRMVYSMAKDVQYTYEFEFNNTVIKL